MADFGAPREGVHRQYDWSEVSPSVAIIETIAAYEGEDLGLTVETRERSLNDCLDADALDALVPDDTELELSFSFSEYAIQITGNEVAVAPDEASPR